MSCRDRLRIMLFALCALFAVVACEEEAPTQAEAAPTPTPVPTAAVAEQFSADAMPLPGKEWLSRFSHMLSAIPANCRCPGKMSVVLCAGDKAIDLIEYGSWHPTGIQQAFQSGVADAQFPGRLPPGETSRSEKLQYFGI